MDISHFGLFDLDMLTAGHGASGRAVFLKTIGGCPPPRDAADRPARGPAQWAQIFDRVKRTSANGLETAKPA